MPFRKRIDLSKVLARITREGASGIISRGEATLLIADRVKGEREALAGARNRIGMQMDRSMEVGSDVTCGGLACVAHGRFTVDEIGRWARPRFPKKFDDLPSIQRGVGEKIQEGIAVGSRTKEEFYPGASEAKDAEIKSLRRWLAELQTKLSDVENAWRRRRADRFKNK